MPKGILKIHYAPIYAKAMIFDYACAKYKTAKHPLSRAIFRHLKIAFD